MNREQMEAPVTEPERQYYFIEEAKDYVRQRALDLGRPLTCCVTTFGCQMNARDSEKLRGILREIGYESAPEAEADLILYNTCTVRENANTRVYGRLGQLKNQKKKNPEMIIGLCGCMMQEEAVVEKIRQSYPFVDLIFGTHNLDRFAEILAGYFRTGKPVIAIQKEATSIVEDLPNERKYAFKSGIDIMYGCDNFCSYCIVPYVRGRERSRDPDQILKEIRRMVADGVVEVMLLGQNVNSYGKTLERPMTFAQLLQEVEAIDGLRRIRFMTSHPKDLSDDLIEVMKNSSKICRHLHLPMQSGSTRILQKMNRHYTKEDYLFLVDKIKNAMPDISLTTDIMVGFPGEEEADFLDTLDVVKRVGFDSAFTFIYSKRSHTPAADMPDQVPEDVVKDRFDRLLTEVQKAAYTACAVHEGSMQEVLVESVSEQDSSMVTGRLDNNLLVHFKGDADLIGQFQKVRLSQCKGFYFLGESVS